MWNVYPASSETFGGRCILILAEACLLVVETQSRNSWRFDFAGIGWIDWETGSGPDQTVLRFTLHGGARFELLVGATGGDLEGLLRSSVRIPLMRHHVGVEPDGTGFVLEFLIKTSEQPQLAWTTQSDPGFDSRAPESGRAVLAATRKLRMMFQPGPQK